MVLEPRSRRWVYLPDVYCHTHMHVLPTRANGGAVHWPEEEDEEEDEQEEGDTSSRLN